MGSSGITNTGSGSIVIEGCAIGDGAKVVVVNDKVVESSTDDE